MAPKGTVVMMLLTRAERQSLIDDLKDLIATAKRGDEADVVDDLLLRIRDVFRSWVADDRAKRAAVATEPAGRISWVRYARIAEVDAYAKQGWTPIGDDALHAPHGAYGTLMSWPLTTEPAPAPGEPA